jgi:hypothetical protein
MPTPRPSDSSEYGQSEPSPIHGKSVNWRFQRGVSDAKTTMTQDDESRMIT